MNKKTVMGALLASLVSTTAYAGGLERGIYSPEILFEHGTRAEVSYSRTNPSVTSDGFPPFIPAIPNIIPSYHQVDFGFKVDVSDILAVALTSYSPSGYELAYPAFLGGSKAEVKSRAYALSAKADVTENIAVFGAVNYVTLSATAENLPGQPPVPITASEDGAFGYVVGAAYSKPEIALRVSLAYESGTSHTLDTSIVHPVFGVVPQAPSTGKTPEAIALRFQSGIAADTLLFGSIRYAFNSHANLFLSGNQLTDFSDSVTYTLGVGRKINDKLSVSISGIYEGSDGKPSSLNPTGSKTTLAAGFKYSVTENMDFSAGVAYTWLGDNTTDPATTTFAIPFTNNNAWTWGTKVAFHF